MAREQLREFIEREIPGKYQTRTNALDSVKEYILEDFGLIEANDGREVRDSEVEACLDKFYLDKLKATRNERITAARAFILPDGRSEAVNYTCYDARIALALPEGSQVKITVLDLTKAFGGSK
jgi:hypothetical protein